jgi:hypothetical protein
MLIKTISLLKTSIIACNYKHDYIPRMAYFQFQSWGEMKKCIITVFIFSPLCLVVSGYIDYYKCFNDNTPTISLLLLFISCIEFVI